LSQRKKRKRAGRRRNRKKIKKGDAKKSTIPHNGVLLKASERDLGGGETQKEEVPGALRSEKNRLQKKGLQKMRISKKWKLGQSRGKNRKIWGRGKASYEPIKSCTTKNKNRSESEGMRTSKA